jgi:hypothetical protein
MQVQMMGRIYSQASETMIWLGRQTKYDANLLGTFNLLLDEAPGEDSCALQFWPSKMAHVRKTFVSRNALAGLYSCTERSCWKRIWIIQEVALAKRHRVFAGDHHVRYGGVPLLHSMSLRIDFYIRPSSMASVLPLWSERQITVTKPRHDIADLVHALSLVLNRECLMIGYMDYWAWLTTVPTLLSTTGSRCSNFV